jgi:hypothetical protein
VFPVHLQCSAVVAIVDCPDRGQFIRSLITETSCATVDLAFSGVPNEGA